MKFSISILFFVLCFFASKAQSICVAADCKDTIRYPQISITLNGRAYSPEGISSTLWKVVSGSATIDSVNNRITIARNISVNGLYVFSFTAISNKGATGTTFDSVIYIGNQAPVCVMGKSVFTQVNTAVLSGSASFDPERLPITFLWVQTSGPNTATISAPTMSNPIVQGLINGVYVFKLTVTDPSGLIGTGTQIVTVNIPITIIKVVTIVSTYYSDGSVKTATTTVP